METSSRSQQSNTESLIGLIEIGESYLKKAFFPTALLVAAYALVASTDVHIVQKLFACLFLILSIIFFGAIAKKVIQESEPYSASNQSLLVRGTATLMVVLFPLTVVAAVALTVSKTL